jgi:hypothetical protein
MGVSVSEVHYVVERLEKMARPGESIIEVLERLKTKHDLATLDTSTVAYARRELRDARIMFGAAVLSSPDKTLRISKRSQEAISGPHSFELISTYDPAADEHVYRVIEK